MPNIKHATNIPGQEIQTILACPKQCCYAIHHVKSNVTITISVEPTIEYIFWEHSTIFIHTKDWTFLFFFFYLKWESDIWSTTVTWTWPIILFPYLRTNERRTFDKCTNKQNGRTLTLKRKRKKKMKFHSKI